MKKGDGFFGELGDSRQPDCSILEHLTSFMIKYLIWVATDRTILSALALICKYSSLGRVNFV